LALFAFSSIRTAVFFGRQRYTLYGLQCIFEGNGFSYPVGSSEPYLRAWMTATLPVSISFAFLGYTEFAARLPSVIVGLSTIVVTYLLGKRCRRLQIRLDISSAIMSIDFLGYKLAYPG